MPAAPLVLPLVEPLLEPPLVVPPLEVPPELVPPVEPVEPELVPPLLEPELLPEPVRPGNVNELLKERETAAARPSKVPNNVGLVATLEPEPLELLLPELPLLPVLPLLPLPLVLPLLEFEEATTPENSMVGFEPPVTTTLCTWIRNWLISVPGGRTGEPLVPVLPEPVLPDPELPDPEPGVVLPGGRTALPCGVGSGDPAGTANSETLSMFPESETN